MDITNAVVARINELLLEKHMTKRQLLRNGHIPEGTLASIYRHIACSVGLASVFALARGFDMTPAEFLDSELFAHFDLDD